MILVVAQRIPYPPNKGEKLRTYHHIKRMVESGYEVEVVSLRHDDSDNELASALAKHLNISVRLFSMQPKLLRYAKALAKLQAMSVAAFESKQLKDYILNKVASSSNIDSIYLSASSLAPYILNSQLNDNQTLKLNMDFMDVDSDKWNQYAQSSAWPMSCIYAREAKKIKLLEQKTLARFDHVFLIADAEITLFEQSVSKTKPVHKLGNGLDFDAFPPGKHEDKSDTPVYLFTGVMDYKPNIDAVVWFVEECWDAIKSKIPNARFVIAGMNPSAQVQGLTRIEGIEVTGFVEDILPYYHSAWVFVAPFRLARGVQNKVLQASACRIPIVTTPMGAEGIPFATPNSMYFAESSAQFADHCIQAVQDEPQATDKAQQVYEAITATYSWETQLTPLMKALSS